MCILLEPRLSNPVWQPSNPVRSQEKAEVEAKIESERTNAKLNAEA